MEYLISAGAVAVMVAFAVIVRRAEATTRRFLPALDRTPRTATVLGVSSAPRGRFTSGEASEPWMVEVEYVDGGGTVRRESLGDLFDASGVRAFALGSQWQVYGFTKPRGRCLLTEEHDSVPRSGYNLDRLRIRAERYAFRARPGSPILGVMRFTNDDGIGASGVVGLRTSWPGDPASAWAAAQATTYRWHRPRPVPPLRSTQEVGREDAGMHRTVTWGAPIFWVVLALAFAGLLGYATVNDQEIDPLLWVAAGVALAVTTGILIVRATFYPRWHREDLEHRLREGTLCDVVESPLSFPGGDVDSTTAIAVDVSLPLERAAVIVSALRLWAGRGEARDAWGQEPGWIVYRVITAAELFGEEAAGGFIVRDCPAEPGEWLLVSPAQDGDYPGAPYRDGDVTRITMPKNQRKERR